MLLYLGLLVGIIWVGISVVSLPEYRKKFSEAFEYALKIKGPARRAWKTIKKIFYWYFVLLAISGAVLITSIAWDAPNWVYSIISVLILVNFLFSVFNEHLSKLIAGILIGTSNWFGSENADNETLKAFFADFDDASKAASERIKDKEDGSDEAIIITSFAGVAFRFLWKLIDPKEVIEPIKKLVYDAIDIPTDFAGTILNAVGTVFHVLVIINYWMIIAAFACLFLPKEADYGWIIVLLTSITVWILSDYMAGNPFTKKPYIWASKFATIAIYISIFAIVVVPPLRLHAKNFLSGMHNRAVMLDQSLAKKVFGDTYDQQIYRVVSRGEGYINGSRNNVIYPAIGTLLWRADDDELTIGGMLYATFYPQRTDGVFQPNVNTTIRFPISKVVTYTGNPQVANSPILVPAGTLYRNNISGVPDTTLHQTVNDLQAYDTSNYIWHKGNELVLLSYFENNKTPVSFWVDALYMQNRFTVPDTTSVP